MLVKSFIPMVLAVALKARVVIEDFKVPEWEDFKKKYNKTYEDGLEENRRYAIWYNNDQLIALHNILYEAGMASFGLGPNINMDLTTDEFKALLNGLKIESNSVEAESNENLIFNDLPSEVDWSKLGYVTPVKDQLKCGSCWAFSASGAIEGAHFKKTGQLVSLSEQNLLDCSYSVGNLGCEAGSMNQAFNYTIRSDGIDTAAYYPYKGANQKFGIDASHLSFQLYKEGVYFEEDCSSISLNLDRGLLVVGYGSNDDGEEYYLVKNSLGTEWGMEGYIQMSRNKDNHCGIATHASYPVI